MRVNVLTEPHGWILHRCAQELADRVPGVCVNKSGSSSIVYVMPAHRRHRSSLPVVGFYTHPTDDQIAEFAPQHVAHVAMNQQVAERLRQAGVDPVVIRPGVESRKTQISFGVCGRTYPKTGRKGEGLVAQAVSAGYRVVSWGSGWPCPTVGSSPQALADFWRGIDYLLVTSLDEGGPMPVIESIAHGVPVIAPRGVGWCDEFPVLGYERGSWESLGSVLSSLTNPPTWEQWSAQHAALFDRVLA